MQMTEDEFNAKVEAELEAQIDRELEIEKQKKRAEIAYRLRREAASREYDRINQRHPVQNPPSAAEIAERHRLGDEALKRDAESLAANDARWRREEAERAAAAKRGPRMQIPGSEGFRVKPVGS
jgi:hypothetical protein